MSVVHLDEGRCQLRIDKTGEYLCSHRYSSVKNYVEWAEEDKTPDDYCCPRCQKEWKSEKEEPGDELQLIRTALRHLDPEDDEFFEFLCISFLEGLFPDSENAERKKLAARFIRDQLRYSESLERITKQSLLTILKNENIPITASYSTTVVNWTYSDQYMLFAIQYVSRRPFSGQLNAWYHNPLIRTKTMIDKDVMIWAVQGIPLMRQLVDLLKSDARIVAEQVRRGDRRNVNQYRQLMNLLFNVIGCDVSTGWYLSVIERSMIVSKTDVQERQLKNAIASFRLDCKEISNILRMNRIRFKDGRDV